MFIRYKNLIIRDAIIDDAELLANWWNNGQIMAHAGYPNGTGQTVQSIKNSLMMDTDNTHRRLIIEYDSLSIGEMNVRNKGNGIAEIGIKICDLSNQEKGLGRLFLSMLIHYLFSEHGYKKIILDTDLENKRAQHVYEKIGFRQTGVNSDSWLNQAGESRSSVDYELTKIDFINYAK